MRRCATPQRQLDELEEIWDRFTKLKPGELIVDEKIYRELEGRFGEYFRCHGRRGDPEASRTSDIDAEADPLREIIRTGKGQKQDARAQATQGRRGVPAVGLRRWAWSSTRFR